MAFVQNTGLASSANVASLTFAFGVTPTNGNLLILAVCTGGNGNGTVTCTGFTAGGTVVTFPSSADYMTYIYKTAGASESNSYVVTPNSSNWTTVQGWELSGRNTSSPFTFKTNVTAATHASPLTIAPGGGTAAAGDDLLWLGGVQGNNYTAFGIGAPSSFTNGLATHGSGSFSNGMVSAIEASVSGGSTGTISGTATWTGGTDDGGGFLLSVAAAPAATPVYMRWDQLGGMGQIITQ